MFLQSLSENVIDEPNIDIAIANTQSLLRQAETTLKNRVIDVNGETVIDPTLIATARITETFNGKTYHRPIIDLVQQGGGMYGIALAGYTYIMEKAGIRFYSLGGTSAGGINAMLLGTFPNSIYENPSPINPEKQGSKSELLAHIISNTQFSKFMDRGGIAGKLQKIALNKLKRSTLRWIGIALLILLPIAIYTLFSVFVNEKSNLDLFWTRTYDFVIGTLVAFVPILLAYLLLIRILGKQFGINSGDAFYEWMNAILKNPFVNIHTTADLMQRLAENRFDTANENDCARMVLITSNLSYNRIVKFPGSAQEYWEPCDNVNPAAYVRATMSIPFVFNTFIPDLKHVENNAVPTINKCRFVDGGLLSNFPIREFHNNSLAHPRFPTFGVLLNESPINLEASAKEIREEFKESTLMNYIISFLSTFRKFYDNDYLRSTDEIRLRVVDVKTKGFDWLDFWMQSDAKEELFRRGAEAAIRQLAKFNFPEYVKDHR
jgi:NTE family protein